MHRIVKFQRAESIQKGRGSVLELIAKRAPLSETLEALVNSAESAFPDLYCSIVLLDPATQSLQTACAPSLPPFYSAAINGIRIGPTVGSCGAAAYHRKVVIVEDILNHPNWEAYLPLVTQTKLRACWSHPLFSSAGEVLGTFAMYYEAPKRPDEEESQYIVSAANLASIAIESDKTHQALQARAAELTKSNEELQHFAYIVSHDLQSPLRQIRGFAEILKDGANFHSERDQECLKYILAGAEKMSHLIKDILTYSRVGGPAAKIQRADLNTVVSHVISSLTDQIKISGAKIRHDELPIIHADPTQMTQLFQNLFENALKFVKPDLPPEIELSSIDLPLAWKFSVKDNGVGIDPRHFERIFMMFQRLYSDNEYEGTGAGLAICRKIVDVHGGEIVVNSEPGKGSVFSFTISKNLAALTPTNRME